MNPSFRALLKNQITGSLSIFAMGILGVSYGLVDQYFAAKVSSDHLYLVTICSYLPMAFILLARILGQTTLVLFNRYPDKKRENFSGAIKVFIICSAFIGSAIPFLPNLESPLGISEIAGSGQFSLLIALSGFLLGANLLMKFMMASVSKASMALPLDLLGNIVNAIWNYMALTMFGSPEYQIIGMAAATLASQSVVFLTLGSILAYDFKYKSGCLREYLSSAKHIISGDIFAASMSIAAPLAFSLYLKQKIGVEVATAFNVGLTLVMFLDRYFVANVIVATTKMARDLAKGSLESMRQSALVQKWATLPFLVALTIIIKLFLVDILAVWFNLHGTDAILIVGSLLAVQAVEVIVYSQRAGMRAGEQQKTLAVIDLLLGMPGMLAVFIPLFPALGLELAFAVSTSGLVLFKAVAIQFMYRRCVQNTFRDSNHELFRSPTHLHRGQSKDSGKVCKSRSVRGTLNVLPGRVSPNRRNKLICSIAKAGDQT